MKPTWIHFTIIVYLSFSLMGCDRIANRNVSSNITPLPSDITQTTSIASRQGDSTPMFPDLLTPTASGLEDLIAKAKEDLAQRLSISIDQIRLIDVTEVEWSNSSLDCPQPGFEYLQVITLGYRILLEANDIQYEYHSNRDAYLVYCENINPPILPKP